MSDSPILSTLTLPAELDADDVLGFRDQLAARIALVLSPAKADKKGEGHIALPAGLKPLKALPAHIDLPWKRFDGAASELAAFRSSRASAQADAANAALDETEQDAANADADDRWRAFERWNAGAAGLEDDGKAPSPAEARWLYAQIFPSPDGLRFITRRPRTQWSAMSQRMSLLQEKRPQTIIEGFGGARHYQQLAASHARFGKAFGFTTAMIQRDGGPTDGRPQWVNAREALRTLMQKIESYADPEIEGSQALAAFLLAPYLEMAVDLEKSRKSRAKKAESVSPPPAGPSGTP
jgi:hypothetical protein